MNVHLESASYSELDFATYNKPGFLKVQAAVAAVQQARTLASTPEDMEHAVQLAQAAAERRNTEQHVAEQNFLKARQSAGDRLRDAIDKFERSSLWGTRRLAVEQRIQHAATRFTLKCFEDVATEVREILNALNTQKSAPSHPKPSVCEAVATMPEPKSASGWFERGRRLEQKGHCTAARSAYQKALNMAPGHFQAQNRLARLQQKTVRPHPGYAQQQRRGA